MTDSAASKAAAAGTMPGPAIGNPIQRILVARGLRDFGDGLVAVLLPAYLLALGFGAAGVGAVATLALLGSALMTLGVGVAGGRAGPRFLLLLAAGLMTATGVGFALAVGFMVIALVALVGTINPSAGSVSIFAPLEQALLTGASSDSGRTAVFARYSLVGALAAAVGALAAGAPKLLARIGVTELEALRSSFLVYAALGVACFLAYRSIPVLLPRIAASGTHRWGRPAESS